MPAGPSKRAAIGRIRRRPPCADDQRAAAGALIAVSPRTGELAREDHGVAQRWRGPRRRAAGRQQRATAARTGHAAAAREAAASP